LAGIPSCVMLCYRLLFQVSFNLQQGSADQV
jgi:hypothetical protein